MVVDLLAQGIEVPPLSSRQIAAEADAVLAEYAKRFGPITKPPIEIEDVATSVLPLRGVRGSFVPRETSRHSTSRS